MNDKAMTCSVIALVAICLTLITDCTFASVQWRAGTVTDRIIQPGWVEYHHSEHGETSTTYHPPQYFVCAEVDGRTGRIAVTLWQYDQWKIGDHCDVQFRKGKLMTYGYLTLRRSGW